MCRASFTLYPCNHTVLTYWEPCTSGAHPSNCNPDNLIIYVTPFHNSDSELPSTCPASKLGRKCVTVSPHPKQFAEYCVSNKVAIEDAVAIAPVWLYNLQGDKIGTRRRPWRLIDYIISLALAENPRALHNHTQPKKRKAVEEQQSETKKPKIESTKSADTEQEGESVISSSAISQEELEQPSMIMKVES